MADERERFDELAGGMDKDDQHRTDTIHERVADVAEEASGLIEVKSDYTPEMDAKFYDVTERPKDVNPRIKIKYSTGNVYKTLGPRDYHLAALKKGEKRARFLFVTIDMFDPQPYFPMGTAYLAAVLEQNDYDVDTFHGTCRHLGPKELEKFLQDNKAYDYIGIGYLTNYVHDVIRYCAAIRAVSPHSKIILGCNGFSALPGFYLTKTGADYGVSGEAENSLLNLLNALTVGADVEDIPSVSFRDGERIYVNKLREPVPDITKIPWPAYHLFPIEDYVEYVRTGYHKGKLSFVFLQSRGCPYMCNFCYRHEEGHRIRPVDDVVAEMAFLYERYHITDLNFYDELFMITEKQVSTFCEGIIRAKDQNEIPRELTWMVCSRFNTINKNIAEILKEAGCRMVLFGLESGDPQALDNMNKKITVDQIRTGVNYAKEAGLQISLPCMFGNIAETRDSIMKTVDLLQELAPNEYRTLRPVTPYPGSPLYEYALQHGLLKDHEDFFQRSKNPDLLTVNFTSMTDREFYEALMEANESLVREYFRRRAEMDVESYRSLYFRDDDSSFEPHRTQVEAVT